MDEAGAGPAGPISREEVHTLLDELAKTEGVTFNWMLEHVEEAGADTVLNLRTALRVPCASACVAAGLLFRMVSFVDLRDNRLTNAEAELIGAALEHTGSLAKLSVGGNRIGSIGAKALGAGMAPFCPVVDLDLSRNPICLRDESQDAPVTDACVLELARVVAQSRRLRVLGLSKVGLEDDLAGVLCAALNEYVRTAYEEQLAAAPEPPPVVAAVAGVPSPPPPARPTPHAPTLTELDLSHNRLREACGTALIAALSVCPSLTTLNLQGNGLGVEGGKAVAQALSTSMSLRTLDLSSNNLCGCNPEYATTPKSIWAIDAISALAEALPKCVSLQRVILTNNELSGMWMEHVCGEYVTQGTYTTAAVDALVAPLRRERLALKRDGIRVDQNLLRGMEEKRLQQALLENERLAKKQTTGPPPTFASVLASMLSSKFAPTAATPAAMLSTTTPKARTGRSESESFSSAAKRPAGGERAAGSALWTITKAPPLREVDVQSKAAEAKPLDMSAVAVAAVAVEQPPEGPAANAPAASTSALPSAQADAAPAAQPPGVPAPAVQQPAGSSESPETAAPGGPPQRQRRMSIGGKAPTAKGGDKAVAPTGDDKGGAKEAAADRSSVGGSKATAKSKKKGAAAEPEAEPDPLADLPLFIAMSALVVRVEAAVDSAKLGDKLPAGALMRVVEETEFITGITKLVTKRMKVVLDGDQEPTGWVTGLTTDNIENLKPANGAFPLMRAAKVLVCREGTSTKDKKLDDIVKGTHLRLLAQQTSADGSIKAQVGRDGVSVDPIGWITLAKSDKDEANLEPVPTLSNTFDLKAHSAKSLSRALKRKQDMAKSASPTRKKKGEGGLPFMVVGGHPARKGADDGLPSRHAVVTHPAAMVLMCNCIGAAFEVTEWTGAMPFELPGEQSFDLVSKVKRRRLGRVALAKDLHEPFLDRIQFPDEWVLADDCGLEHDGWQGDGILDLELTCGKAVATIRITPWLAYGCSTGARINIRQAGSSQGQCATVHRILTDDRIVAKVDGYAKVCAPPQSTVCTCTGCLTSPLPPPPPPRPPT